MKAPKFLSHSKRGSVAGIGEEALIRSIRRWLGAASPPAPAGIGDDCAVLPPSRKTGLVTVDPVIRGVHFDDSTPAAAVGAKLLKRNLSDIAAMGGNARAAVVALAIDRSTSLRWLKAFYRGLAREGRRYRVPIVGGDVARLDGAFVATLTLFGELPGRALSRRGARLGDWIYVTGRLGRSLQTGHHLAFKPRLAEGAWLARRTDVRSMIDLSDGLAKDLEHLCPRGSVAALFPERLPRRKGASVAEALSDGEDYELAFTVATKTNRSSFERSWSRMFPRTPLSCIGRFVRPSSVPEGALTLAPFHGYEHFR